MSTRTVTLVARLSDLSVWTFLNAGAIAAALCLGVAGIYLGQWRQEAKDVGRLAQRDTRIESLQRAISASEGRYLVEWQRNQALTDINHALYQERNALATILYKEALP